MHGSYIKGAAVHETYNRAVTIHGVHFLTIQDVVAYNNMGHTFFIEDAIESQNRFACCLWIVLVLFVCICMYENCECQSLSLL